MNIQLKDITVTARDGRVSHLEQVYIRGSHVRFFIVPDMLRYDRTLPPPSSFLLLGRPVMLIFLGYLIETRLCLKAATTAVVVSVWQEVARRSAGRALVVVEGGKFEKKKGKEKKERERTKGRRRGCREYKEEENRAAGNFGSTHLGCGPMEPNRPTDHPSPDMLSYILLWETDEGEDDTRLNRTAKRGVLGGRDRPQNGRSFRSDDEDGNDEPTQTRPEQGHYGVDSSRGGRSKTTPSITHVREFGRGQRCWAGESFVPHGVVGKWDIMHGVQRRTNKILATLPCTRTSIRITRVQPNSKMRFHAADARGFCHGWALPHTVASRLFSFSFSSELCCRFTLS